MQIIAVLIVIAGISPVIIGVLAGRIAVDVESFSPRNVILLVVGIGLIYFVLRSQSRSGEQRMFQQDPTSNKRLDLRFSEEGVTSRVEGLSETVFQWSGFVRVRRTAKGFLFYHGPYTFLWVPEHAFGSKTDADAVTALVKQRVINYSES